MFYPPGDGEFGSISNEFLKKAALAERGIFIANDDDYDYDQHLRQTGAQGSELVLADPEQVAKKLKEKISQGLVLPSAALPTTLEQTTTLSDLQATQTGLQLNWDPDVAALLDDDAEEHEDW